MPKSKNTRKGKPKQARPRVPPPPPPGGRGRGRVVMVVALLGVAALVFGLAALAGGGGGEEGSTPASGDCTGDRRTDRETRGNNHTDSAAYDGPASPRDNPRYSVDPPSGGDHLSNAARPGVYEGADVPPDGALVHSLEHGYVVVWFKPGLAGQLEQVRAAYPRDVLLVERATMQPQVAATAWGRRLLCSGVDVDALTDFVRDRRNKGPEKVPH